MIRKLFALSCSTLFGCGSFSVVMSTIILTSRMGGEQLYLRFPTEALVAALIGGLVIMAAFAIWLIRLEHEKGSRR